MDKNLKKEIIGLFFNPDFNPDCINWEYIVKKRELSENFIEEFQDKIDWVYISEHQKLSEKFIERYQNKVHWFCIFKYQNLSDEFFKKYCNKINLNYSYIEDLYSKKLYNKLKEYQQIKPNRFELLRLK